MNPFLDNKFDNGVEIPSIVLKLYSMLDPALKSRWCGSETATGDDSFFAWLNAPADADTQVCDDLPVITNLAYYVYSERPGLQTAFPDLFGADRHRFARWFIVHAQPEYALDKAFLEPTYSGWRNASRISKDNECEEPLKIFVVGTPKAGNTWMTYLLSTIYDLPPVTLPTIFDPSVTDRAGTSWVAMQHYWLEPDIFAWAKQRRTLFVTMMRHPGDVLVSLWHMMRNKSYDPDADLRFVQLLMHDDNQMDEHTVRYVKEHFSEVVQLSLDWANSGASFIVRYEDLWRDPVTTLARLTNSIRPVSQDRIESAIDVCNINMLRKLGNDPQHKFFRKGGPGNWRRELPDNIVDVFRHHKPYPTLFQNLGYTLDSHDPLIDAPAKPRVSTSPFVDKAEFDNGIEIPAIAIKRYLKLDPLLKSRWRGSETATGDDSFFAWLNAPADADTQVCDDLPVITNLAHYVYSERLGLQTAFPDLFGADRHRFARWFIVHAQLEYALDKVFLEPTYSGWWNVSRTQGEKPPKILIVGTPKTGNMWMKHLLSTIYDLPPVALPTIFDPSVTDQAGASWVTLQHYELEPDVLAWAKRHGAIFVTMMRHPGDALVSLWHMMHNKSYDPGADLRFLQLLLHDSAQMDEYALQYVKEHFAQVVQLSLNWENSGVSLVVRYEDLWRDPVATLTRLTDSIHPVSQERIESAIDVCDINMLRKLGNDPQRKFFRKGGPGSWRRELPDDIVDVFHHHKPYPALFQIMGYTLDPHDPLIDAPAKPRVSTSPFVDKTEFDNGIEIPAIAIKRYLMLDPALKSRWHGAETETAQDSFFAWLNAPVDADVHRCDNMPIITNLAQYIYSQSHDLQIVFPDLFGEDRYRFAHWFVTHAQAEYGLDKVFIEPVRSSVRITLSIIDANIIVPTLAFLLRCKLSSLLKKMRIKI